VDTLIPFFQITNLCTNVAVRVSSNCGQSRIPEVKESLLLFSLHQQAHDLINALQGQNI